MVGSWALNSTLALAVAFRLCRAFLPVCIETRDTLNTFEHHPQEMGPSGSETVRRGELSAILHKINYHPLPGEYQTIMKAFKPNTTPPPPTAEGGGGEGEGAAAESSDEVDGIGKIKENGDEGDDGGGGGGGGGGADDADAGATADGGTAAAAMKASQAAATSDGDDAVMEFDALEKLMFSTRCTSLHLTEARLTFSEFQTCVGLCSQILAHTLRQVRYDMGKRNIPNVGKV